MRTAMRSGDWLAIVLDALVVPATLHGQYKLSRMLVLVYASENWRILILYDLLAVVYAVPEQQSLLSRETVHRTRTPVIVRSPSQS